MRVTCVRVCGSIQSRRSRLGKSISVSFQNIAPPHSFAPELLSVANTRTFQFNLLIANKCVCVCAYVWCCTTAPGFRGGAQVARPPPHQFPTEASIFVGAFNASIRSRVQSLMTINQCRQRRRRHHHHLIIITCTHTSSVQPHKRFGGSG